MRLRKIVNNGIPFITVWLAAFAAVLAAAVVVVLELRNIGRSKEASMSPEVQSHGVITAIIQAGCAGRFMAGHLLGDFELAAILQVRGDPGSPEAVSANLRFNPGFQSPTLNHGVDIGLR